MNALTVHAPSPSANCQPPAKRQPRMRPPSERDLEIYKRVKIKGFEQWEVAQDQQLHYSRVSQIVKRVGRWLAAGGCPTDPLLRDHAARQRLARATLKMRLQRAVELASMALELPTDVEITRRRVQGLTEVWREEMTRSVSRVNLGALKMLIDAAQTLERMEQEEKEQGTTPPASDEEVLRCVFDLLCGLRTRAEQSQTLPPAANLRSVVAAGLVTILGPQVTDLCRLSVGQPEETAQASVPTAQVTFPIAQASRPNAQESLQLNAADAASNDATTCSALTSVLPTADCLPVA